MLEGGFLACVSGHAHFHGIHPSEQLPSDHGYFLGYATHGITVFQRPPKQESCGLRNGAISADLEDVVPMGSERKGQVVCHAEQLPKVDPRPYMRPLLSSGGDSSQHELGCTLPTVHTDNSRQRLGRQMPQHSQPYLLLLGFRLFVHSMVQCCGRLRISLK